MSRSGYWPLFVATAALCGCAGTFSGVPPYDVVPLAAGTRLFSASDLSGLPGSSLASFVDPGAMPYFEDEVLTSAGDIAAFGKPVQPVFIFGYGFSFWTEDRESPWGPTERDVEFNPLDIIVGGGVRVGPINKTGVLITYEEHPLVLPFISPCAVPAPHTGLKR